MCAMPTTVRAVADRLGARRLSDGKWEFLLWAPNARAASLHLLCGGGEPIAMAPLAPGYHRVVCDHVQPGCRYLYQLDDGRELPDPASRFQPDGVHGPSQIVDVHAFHWTDHAWRGRTLESSIFYELHVGAYTAEGTFDALIPHLPELVDLGITTVELMPIAQFPGARNWGYDGVYPFAAQNSYGGPEGLQRFVNAAHLCGLSVALDVVYNHLGPEGNYLGAYGPYFTDRYRTPWGEAVNYDGAYSDEVRRFFIENALYWLEDCHVDVLRLDAIHGIFDLSARHFLAELKSAVDDLARRLGRPLYLIAESDLNDNRVLRAAEEGGYGLDGQWSDDFHHSVHSLLTKERFGYYVDFEGTTPLVETMREGWYFHGQYSRFRKRRHGNSPRGIPPSRFVVCNQNHDQVGNRARGERLTSLVKFEALKLAAGITLLSPFVPLLFMGEEYGESAPFQYFTSHGDAALVDAVRRGRREEFAEFGWKKEVPDPQNEATFSRSRLDHSIKVQEPHRTLLRFYREVIQIREQLKTRMPGTATVTELVERAILAICENSGGEVVMIFNFADRAADLNVPRLTGNWASIMYSAAACWRGPEEDVAPEITVGAELRMSPQLLLVIKRTLPNPEEL